MILDTRNWHKSVTLDFINIHYSYTYTDGEKLKNNLRFVNYVLVQFVNHVTLDTRPFPTKIRDIINKMPHSTKLYMINIPKPLHNILHQIIESSNFLRVNI